MSGNLAVTLSELAERLKAASPLESPAVARQIRKHLDSVAEMTDQVRRLGDSGVLEQAAKVAAQLQMSEAQLERMAAEVRQLHESGALGQADMAERVQMNEGDLLRAAEQVRQLHESGALERMQRYLRGLEEVSKTQPSARSKRHDPRGQAGLRRVQGERT